MLVESSLTIAMDFFSSDQSTVPSLIAGVPSNDSTITEQRGGGDVRVQFPRIQLAREFISGGGGGGEGGGECESTCTVPPYTAS